MAQILIVDDSAIMRRNLKTILVQAGHTVVGEAINGGQAHLMYRTHVPDLVTMDITMPNVNGIEAVKLIKKEFPDAKIIMVSALDQRSMVLEALKQGANHYIVKPITPETVIEVVNKVLNIQPNVTNEADLQPEETVSDGADEAPFTIENIDNTFQIKLSPNLSEDSFAMLMQAVQGLMFVKPLKVLLNFNSIETLPDPLLPKIADIVTTVKRAKGIIRVVARNKNFVTSVKEKKINNLSEVMEGI
ncbi:MAG: response regulator [Desulfosporosinus sp.]|nr:response regulator [Desulfosporosinus sp.]MBC2726690.1 response regulator [Desulfosporosinus sp.]